MYACSYMHAFQYLLTLLINVLFSSYRRAGRKIGSWVLTGKLRTMPASGVQKEIRIVEDTTSLLLKSRGMSQSPATKKLIMSALIGTG